jgi:hypothetical protein
VSAFAGPCFSKATWSLSETRAKLDLATIAPKFVGAGKTLLTLYSRARPRAGPTYEPTGKVIFRRRWIFVSFSNVEIPWLFPILHKTVLKSARQVIKLSRREIDMWSSLNHHR